MEDKPIEVHVPGTFSDTEEAILGYLYDNPDGSMGTTSLMSALQPEQQSTAEQREQSFEGIQYGIETLVAHLLVKGKRTTEAGKVRYVQLRLTSKGQAEAIKQKRRLKKIILDIPRPRWEKKAP